MTTTELRALLAAATARPWTAVCRDSRNQSDDPSWNGFHLGWEIEEVDQPARGQFVCGYDAALIVAAVNSLPGLLDERDRLIAKLRSHCDPRSSATVHAFAKELLRDMGETE